VIGGDAGANDEDRLFIIMWIRLWVMRMGIRILGGMFWILVLGGRWQCKRGPYVCDGVAS
jgi:hypothetical protein